MAQKIFILTSLQIHPECADLYRKILKPERYDFNQLNIEEESLEKGVFGKRVFIQTIVGKNGSGKSSLLELMYRMINNFSFYILKYTRPKRIAAAPIFLIEKIYADLNFNIDGKDYSLMIRDRSLGLVRGEEKIYFGERCKEFAEFHSYNDEKKAVIMEVASTFFYTIVTNYSFQSLVTKDFENEVVNDFVTSKKSGYQSNGNWLESLFNKNDGYTTPIVLNPYRGEGKIDLRKEYFLTVSRIAALLIDAEKRGKVLLSGYTLKTIRYKATHEHFLGKLFGNYNPADDSIYLTSVMMAVRNRSSVAGFIISMYGLNEPELKDEEHIVPYAYLIYKTLNVLDTYAQFEAYEKIPAPTEFQDDIGEGAKVSLDAAIKEILKDHSHNNVKIFQTLNYINAYGQLKDKFDLDAYLPFNNNDLYQNLDQLIEHLPPPFYEQDIRLKRENEPESDIPVSSLSSGERQFIYTISTIIYHIRNLLSIQQSNRIRYRNVNIVLDEVEICFHPEYQRLFISQLVELIERLSLSRYCSFNILIVTHSPFVLSDIPQKNILYLASGRQYENGTMVNPFAANINDILYQSFFLDGGFIGEHAKKVINEAVEVLDKRIRKKRVAKDTFWTQDKIKNLIDMVGEPLLKDNLTDLYRQAFAQLTYEELISDKNKEIELLKRLLEQSKTN
jgi:energy-coupling factor transporter ATP-binding protein EcfA2